MPGYPDLVAMDILGRTNQTFPNTWLRLVGASDQTPVEIVNQALTEKTVIDFSANPALWGGQMRGTDALLMAKGGLEIERAPDEKAACDLIQAHLIETLSAIGREHIDFYFLQVRRALEEYQIHGALQALENAKSEGHIRFLGLSAEGPGLAVQNVWQFHDAFEVLLLRDPDQGLEALAKERRVGVVTEFPSDYTQLIPTTELAGASR